MLLGGLAAAADVVSPGPEDIELTIYREGPVSAHELGLDRDSHGIAMVTETRTIDVPAGTSVLRFRGVAAGIVPQTAKLTDAPVEIAEANFDYNLLTPGTLIANSLGRPVRLISTNPSTGAMTERRAVLRSGPNGVVLDFDGSIEALKCSGLHERLVFDDVPASLTETPTLSLVVRAPAAGRYEAQLSYLTLGLDWAADYSLDIHSDGRRLDLSAWLTLVNRGTTQFTSATTHVVAGNLSRVDDTEAPAAEIPSHQDACWPIGEFRLLRRVLPEPSVAWERQDRVLAFGVDEVAVSANFVAKMRELGDYKMYTLPVATTVAPRQMKQVRLLDRRNVRFEQVYEYRVQEFEYVKPLMRPTVLLRLQNDKRSGLGVPLPGGTVAVMHRTDGARVLAGEDSIDDTPVGAPFEIRYARALDVLTWPKIIERTDVEGDKRKERLVIEVELANGKSTPIQLEVLHGHSNEDRVIASTHRHAMWKGEPRWVFRLRPGEQRVLRYTVEHRK